jgi:hypothetical protein
MMFFRHLYLYFVLFLLLMANCSPQTRNEEEKNTDSTTSNASKVPATEEEENEYIFEEKKANVSESQKKGVMLNVVRQYCQSQMEQDYTKLMSLFADSVLQYLGAKKITKEMVAQIAKSKHKDKKNIRYTADYGKLSIEGYTLYIPIKYGWENFSAEVQAEISFDEAFNIVAFTERPLTQAKIPLQKQWEGKYEFEGGRQVEAYLEIKAMQDRKFSFVVEINSEGNCKGKFEGKAVLIEDTEASSIETEECKITFSLKDRQISIEEMPNCSLHGATCSFAGVYTKR